MVKEISWHFSCRIENFPIICCYTLSATAYVVFISLLHYARPCHNYSDFFVLYSTFYNRIMLIQDLGQHHRNFYGRHHELVNYNGVLIFTIWTDFFNGSQFIFLLSSTLDFMINSMGVSGKTVPSTNRCTCSVFPDFGELSHFYVLVCLFRVLCCVCLFFKSSQV